MFIGGGTTMSILYLARLALRNPDVWYVFLQGSVLRVQYTSLA